MLDVVGQIQSIHPRNSFVLLRPLAKKERTAEGVIIPENSNAYHQCEVMAVGRGDQSVADGSCVGCDDLQVGMLVLAKLYDLRPLPTGHTQRTILGIEVTVGGEKQIMVPETAIVGIIYAEDRH